MVEVMLIIAFFAALAIGGVAAGLLGRLPTTEQLEEEDQARYDRYQRTL
jgi:hypothetical protein